MLAVMVKTHIVIPQKTMQRVMLSSRPEERRTMCFLLSVCMCVCMCVCVCVCGHVYVVYEDTNLYNDMGMT